MQAKRTTQQLVRFGLIGRRRKYHIIAGGSDTLCGADGGGLTRVGLEDKYRSLVDDSDICQRCQRKLVTVEREG
jgi:hypothetical protein